MLTSTISPTGWCHSYGETCNFLNIFVITNLADVIANVVDCMADVIASYV